MEVFSLVLDADDQLAFVVGRGAGFFQAVADHVFEEHQVQSPDLSAKWSPLKSWGDARNAKPMFFGCRYNAPNGNIASGAWIRRAEQGGMTFKTGMIKQVAKGYEMALYGHLLMKLRLQRQGMCQNLAKTQL